jgi:hypothetical protein
MKGADASQSSASRLIKASDGKTRIDTGTQSVITDPMQQQAVLLDHVKKTAQIMPMKPSMPQMPQIPGMPQAPQAPKPPDMPQVSMQDLGKSFIEGHEVEGKRFIVQPPTPPDMPKPPDIPKPPQIPGMPTPPQAPQAPQAPTPPPMPTVADVWSSTSLKTPVLTKVSGPFGDQTTYCKPQQTGEPHPGLFQIPPGYTPIMPKPPEMPKPPSPPAMPSPPKVG